MDQSFDARFELDERALSSGCIRVEDALELVYLLLAGLVVIVALLSAGAIALSPVKSRTDAQFWTFTRMHAGIYRPAIERWNSENPGRRIDMTVFSLPALERRTMSSFLARTAMAELLEVERTIAQRAFGGPLDAVGFVDLTDRLRDEGLLERINAASFSPWTSRGRIFGIPHDVHPVMLAYRSDLTDAAGIDMSTIETWEDYFRAMRPLMGDKNSDGEPDRYLISFWETHAEPLEMMLLQAGGGFFDESGEPTIGAEINVRTMATLACWVGGPNRVAADAPDFSASGNELKLKGYVVASFMPDWMCDIFEKEIPQLAGKLRLMPLPAWERGGRRTSVWRGGTMLGLNKKSPRLADAWAFVRHLAISTELAEDLYRRTNIVPPNTSLWKLKVFDEPDSYYRGQPVGRLYLDQAADVPVRSSSPFAMSAQVYVGNALVLLRAHADETGTFDEQALRPVAQRLLDEAQRRLAREIQRNTFLAPAS